LYIDNIQIINKHIYMNNTTKVLTIFGVGVALGYFLNSKQRGKCVGKVKRQIQKWRNKNASKQEVLARRYYLSEDPIDEIAR